MPTARSGPEDRQPVSISEHLDLLAMAEVIARRLRNQATVYAAIMAGASWAHRGPSWPTRPDRMPGRCAMDFLRWMAAQRHCTRTMARAGWPQNSSQPFKSWGHRCANLGGLCDGIGRPTC